MDKNKILIGKFGTAVGIKGELKVNSYSSDSHRFSSIEKLYSETKEFYIENVRYNGKQIILKIKGIDDRNEALKLTGIELYISDSDLEELEEGCFYVKDLIGAKIISRKGEILGELISVHQDRPQELYEIKKNDGGIAYVPVVDEYIISINGEIKEIVINTDTGILEI
ncbi:MAG: ribosome maturation factor RimM [Anaerovoracaceae bacterium]